MLFITHDFGVVAEIADRVVVMQYGKVVETGPVDDVLRRPQHPYSKMLIASVPSLDPPARRPRKRSRNRAGDPQARQDLRRRRLSQKAREVHAAKDVTIDVRRGETVGIVGESGSGKSTVARCIARLIEPSSGAIDIGGLDVAHLVRAAAAAAPEARPDRLPGPLSLAQSRAARSATR